MKEVGEYVYQIKYELRSGQWMSFRIYSISGHAIPNPWTE